MMAARTNHSRPTRANRGGTLPGRAVPGWAVPGWAVLGRAVLGWA